MMSAEKTPQIKPSSLDLHKQSLSMKVQEGNYVKSLKKLAYSLFIVHCSYVRDSNERNYSCIKLFSQVVDSMIFAYNGQGGQEAICFFLILL